MIMGISDPFSFWPPVFRYESGCHWVRWVLITATIADRILYGQSTLQHP